MVFLITLQLRLINIFQEKKYRLLIIESLMKSIQNIVFYLRGIIFKEIFEKEKKNIKWLCHIDKKHFPKNYRKHFA